MSANLGPPSNWHTPFGRSSTGTAATMVKQEWNSLSVWSIEVAVVRCRMNPEIDAIHAAVEQTQRALSLGLCAAACPRITVH